MGKLFAFVFNNIILIVMLWSLIQGVLIGLKLFTNVLVSCNWWLITLPTTLTATILVLIGLFWFFIMSSLKM